MSFRNVYGNDWSENRWRMCNRDECVLVAGPHMNTAPLRRGPAEILLGDLVRRYDVQCAPVASSVWGWSATNDVGNSNHLSGTAVDVNAPQWPWGYRTMGAALIAKITALVDFYEGAIYWGRNWSRPDEMHFQLNWPEGDIRYARIIAKVQGSSVPVSPGVPSDPSSEDLDVGSEGQQVKQLQAGLNRVFSGYSKLDVDGIFGVATKSAVTEFQRREKAKTPSITVDGIVGPVTRRALATYGIVLTADGGTPTNPGGPVALTDSQKLDKILADVDEIRKQLSSEGDPSWTNKGTSPRDLLYRLVTKVGA